MSVLQPTSGDVVKRPNKVTLMLSDDELAKLRELSTSSGVSASTVLRSVLYLPSFAFAAAAEVFMSAKKLG